MDEARDLYDKDKDFKKYVDAVAFDLNVRVDDALRFEAVKKIAAKKKDEMEQR